MTTTSNLVKTHRHRLRRYKLSFVGREAVTWMVQTNQSSSRTEAMRLLDDLLTVGAITHVTRAHTFKDERYFYRWSSLEALQLLVDVETETLQLSATRLYECRAELIDLHGKISRRAKTRHTKWSETVKPRISNEISTLSTQLEEISNVIRQKETNTSAGVDAEVELEGKFLLIFYDYYFTIYSLGLLFFDYFLFMSDDTNNSFLHLLLLASRSSRSFVPAEEDRVQENRRAPSRVSVSW
jgi:hypothetical protein